jgi:polysaccharide biosynthesis transport protein
MKLKWRERLEAFHREPMLDRNRRYKANPSRALGDYPPIQLVALGGTFLRRWRRIVAVALLVLLIGLSYLIVTPPQYTAAALILINPKNPVLLRDAPTLDDSGIISARIGSEVEILRSERVLRQVVQTETLVNNHSLQPGFFSTAVSWVKTKILGSEHAPGHEDPLAAASRALRDRTSARRIGATFVVEVTATMMDSSDAVRVTNSYARTYIDDQAQLREDAARRNAKVLRERTEELRAEAHEAEQAVEQFKFAEQIQDANSASARVAALKNLESVAQTFRVVYDRFLEKYAETLQQQNTRVSEAQIVSMAYSPAVKTWPKTTVVLAAALLVGVLLGSLWALLLDFGQA